MELANKVAVVTGGSSGIGLAAAKRLSEEGAKVALFGRDKNKLQRAVSGLKSSMAIQGDVGRVKDLERLYQEVSKKWGKIDIVVANAGIAERKKLEDVSEEFFDEIVRINYKGVFFTIQKALPFLKEGASVILISSAAAHIGIAGHSVYSSTKAAVSYLASSFAAELVDRGIRVNAISPGLVDTPIFDRVRTSAPEQMEKFASFVPLKRFATAEEIAEGIFFLASPRSSYIVGSDLLIDGGLKSPIKF